MKKTSHWGLSVIRFIFEAIIFVIGAVFVGLIAYVLGFAYLQSVKGNDSFYHLTNLLWVNRFFPFVPYWYPLQNGGVVPMWGYPFFSYYLLTFIHKLSQIDLISLYQWIGFASVPLTALGLFVFCWTRLRNVAVGLVGAIFYVLAPIAWVWLFEWGFYTESISYIFVFPILTLYDVYLTSFQESKGEPSLAPRLAFVGAVLLNVALFLTHPNTFFVTLVIIGLWTLTGAINAGFKPFSLLLKRLFIPLVLFTGFSLALTSFLLLNFLAYSGQNPSAPTADMYKEFVENYPTPVKSLLGLETIAQTEFKYVHRTIVMPLAVWIPALIGLLGALLYRRKLLALGFLAFLPVITFTWPAIVYYVTRTIPYSGYALSHRSVLIYIRFLMPLLGAFGLWSLTKIILDIPTFWIKSGKLAAFKNRFFGAVAWVLTPLFGIFFILYFANKPTTLWQPTQIRYGPSVVDMRDPFFTRDTTNSCNRVETDPQRPRACNNKAIINAIDIDQFIAGCHKETQQPKLCALVENGQARQTDIDLFATECSAGKYPTLCPLYKQADWFAFWNTVHDMRHWPKPNVTTGFEETMTRFSPFIDAHKNEQNLRIDVSPYLGGVVQTLNLESDISQINLYAVTLSLLNPYWGYEQQVFFSQNTGNTTNVNNMAKWFGINYLFLDNQLDSLEKYAADTAMWEKVDEAGIWKFNGATKLYSWTKNKPSFLVIGSKEKQAYEPIFRTGVNGGLDYDNAWLVQGKENIDDYSLEELQRFDGLILFGYSYKSQRQAFKLLDDFVSKGGNLVLNTGWQYVDKDWEITKAPDVFPVTDLTWSTAHGVNAVFEILDPELQTIDPSLFSPLKWGDEAWGVSTPKGGLKEWAQPVLKVGDTLVAAKGAYGNGKVVWFGWNIHGHLSTYKFNQYELDFYRGLMDYILPQEIEDENTLGQQVAITRKNPDMVTFALNQSVAQKSTLYWRESVYPNWQATLISKGKKHPIPIYKGGPGFMLMRLPPVGSGDRIELVFTSGWRTWGGYIISFVTLVGLVLYGIRGGKIFTMFNRLLRPFSKSLSQTTSHLTRNFNDEDA